MDTTDADIARRRLKQHLISWATGTPLDPPAPAPASGTRTLVLADAAHLPAVTASGLAGPDTLVLVPGYADEVPPGTTAYDGTLTEPGGEFSNGQDFFLQTHSYAASPFMTVFGPTVVRVFDEADHDAFVADADRALATGAFPEFLVTSSVLLADPDALGGGGHPEDGPALRLYAGPDGQVSLSPTGAVLGTVDDGLDTLTARHAALPGGAAGSDPSHRAHLPRYLAAITALRSLMARGVTGLSVSGFGSRLTPGLAATGADADLADAALPIVLYSDEEAYVVAGSRLFTLDVRAARALECLLATGGRADGLVPAEDVDRTAELLARHAIDLPLPLPVPAAA
ncbi:daptide biosynthesis RiPP recognition protein [Streptomyces sp. NPDC058486]|uniref:daptide biosynthesis RiPP recognition protein n=1 Tax=unclassified Streptomyces TaxID=2593676 RepID=UPI003655D401